METARQYKRNLHRMMAMGYAIMVPLYVFYFWLLWEDMPGLVLLLVTTLSLCPLLILGVFTFIMKRSLRRYDEYQLEEIDQDFQWGEKIGKLTLTERYWMHIGWMVFEVVPLKDVEYAEEAIVHSGKHRTRVLKFYIPGEKRPLQASLEMKKAYREQALDRLERVVELRRLDTTKHRRWR